MLLTNRTLLLLHIIITSRAHAQMPAGHKVNTPFPRIANNTQIRLRQILKRLQLALPHILHILPLLQHHPLHPEVPPKLIKAVEADDATEAQKGRKEAQLERVLDAVFDNLLPDLLDGASEVGYVVNPGDAFAAFSFEGDQGGQDYDRGLHPDSADLPVHDERGCEAGARLELVDEGDGRREEGEEGVVVLDVLFGVDDGLEGFEAAEVAGCAPEG